jgi:hypothetical protein
MTTTDSLLLKFRAKDTRQGVTRSTLKAIAAELDATETQVVHMALSKLAEEVLPAYEADDGPLSAKDLKTVQAIAKPNLPRGKVIVRKTLLG